MALYGPIVLIEDDENDADVIITAIKDLGIPNQIDYFRSAQESYEYLKTTKLKPLVLFSDIRMPGLDGLTLLKRIHADEYLRLKAVPFIFLTGIVTQAVIDEAFNIGIQGIYSKPSDYVKLRDLVRIIVTYWIHSEHPSTAYSDRSTQP